MVIERHDVVIIGGGVAGVSAALECVDTNLDTVVLEGRDELGGQLPEIPHSLRTVATGLYVDGRDLQAGLWGAAALLGDRVRLGHAVSKVALADGRVEVGERPFGAGAVVIATGSTRRYHPAAPDGAFGGDVTYQVEPRADRFAGCPVVVVGGGDSATLDALELADTAQSVALVHRSQRLTARRDIIERVEAETRIRDLPGWEVESIVGGPRLEAVVVVDRGRDRRMTLPAGGLVIKISRSPRTEVFDGQVDLDRGGFVVVDADLRTSCEGVFAAGDVVSGSHWRVATAIGQGALAARSVLRHLEARS